MTLLMFSFFCADYFYHTERPLFFDFTSFRPPCSRFNESSSFTKDQQKGSGRLMNGSINRGLFPISI